MKIKFVPRSEVKITKKGSSKFRPLIDAITKLIPGGHALEVTYTTEKELNSMRNVVYTYNRENSENIKSGKDTVNNRISSSKTRFSKTINEPQKKPCNDYRAFLINCV